MTIDETRATLESRQMSRFVGQPEDLWLEAKAGVGYDLTTAAGRFELAKDVVALANSEGGYLLLGLATTRAPDEARDTVSGLALVAEAEVSVPQIAGVIREYSHPAITGLTIQWHESVEEAGRGVAAILVPPQTENRKWFLLGKVVVDGESIKEIVFGITKRVSQDNVPLSLQEVYRMTQSGKSEVATRLTRIEETLDSIAAAVAEGPAAGRPTAVDALDERINRLL